jgi:amino acid adenylation domain-containing protein
MTTTLAPEAATPASAGVALSPVERRIWAQDRVGTLHPFRPETLVLHIGARWPLTRIMAALAAALAGQPAFATRLETGAGGTVLRQPAPPVRPVLHPPAEDAVAAAMAAAGAGLPDPAGGVAARIDLVPGAAGGHVLAVMLHPVLGDGETLAGFEARLMAALTASPLPPSVAEGLAAVPFGWWDDLPKAERQRRLALWRGWIDAAPVTRLPRLGRGTGSDGPERHKLQLALPADLTRALDPQGIETALAAALTLALQRHSGVERVLFALGTAIPFAPRRSGDLLPVAVAPDPSEGFGALTARLEARLAEARAHRLPAETLVQDRLRRPGADRHPLGAVALHVRRLAALPEGVTRIAAPLPPSAGDLVLTADIDPAGAVTLHADAAAGMWPAAPVARVLDHLARLLAAGLAAPETPVGTIPLLTRDELRSLSAPYPDDAPGDPRATHQIIAAHAATAPARTAILCGDAVWSHGALNAAANRLAHRLIGLGVGAEVPVAIVIERGAEAVMAILAVLKAGGAYIPVEPAHPPARNHHILTDAGVRVILTRTRYLDRLPEGTGATILCLDALPEAGPLPDTDPEVAIHPDQLAYVMYTSGSTGKPKGVAVEHGPLSRHNQATLRVYGMTADSRELPFLPFSSDGGHERWMVPLMAGGSVVIPDGPLWTPEQTLAAMRRHGCNNASIPTTYLQQFAEWAEATGEAPPMRLYSFGGEGLAQATFDLLGRALNAGTLINGYGPTETIMTPMVWKVAAGTRFDGAYAPLGRAVGDRRAYVLDPRMVPCPPGATGEIFLGGTGIARGYVGRPGTTADRFIPDPFGPDLDGSAGGRLYRTGDLGRWREDGTIEFLGRVDLQVKLDGHRIEPGEIEAALLAEPGVSEALVLLREDDGEKRLVGYVTGPAPGSEDDLMRGIEARLPAHMLPSALVVLDRMPTNPNAKLDRAALPVPGRTLRRGAGVAPEGEREAQILAIWREEIGAPEMGVTDDFFAMGGKSLTALKVLARLRRLWPDMPLGIADLFDAPTVRRLADRIAAGDQTGRSAIALRASGSRPRLYCFPGLLVSTREYLRLTDFLGPDQPVTGFLCQSLNEEKRQTVAVEDVVADYVDHIRREAAGGPCAFLGWSWGGLLAWEAARQLQGEVDLRLVGMVDVCDLGSDFAPGVVPVFAPGERAALEAALADWLGRSRMRPQWDRLIGAMDRECFAQFLRFIGNEADPLPCDGPEIASREHTFWVLIDNALVFRRHLFARLSVPVASFSAGDSLSRGLNLIDWRAWSPRATAAEIIPGTNHLHIIGERQFHERFRERLDAAFA